MDEPTNVTPSDLLYLFLDGEADSMQQTILFGALAGDGELQTEFAQALHVRSALERERNEIRPPATVTHDLFAKAGFGAPIAESSNATEVNPIGGFLGRFGIPFLCAATGALITALFFGSIYGNEIDVLKREMAMTARASTPTRGNDARPSPGLIAARDGDAANTTGRLNAMPVHAGGRGGTGRYSQADIVRAPRAVRNAQIPATVPREPAAGGHAEQAIISSTPPRSLPIELHRNSGSMTIASIAPIPSPDPLAMREDDADIPVHRYSAQLRGITDLRFYPDREINGVAQPWYGNTSIGGLYQLNEHHAIGIGIGEDRMPMYSVSGSGSVRNDRLFWAGGSYQLHMNRIEVLGGVQPFFEGIAGGTVMGPIAKGMVGISYAPEGRVSIGVGIEGTALLYQLRGQWYTTQKAGVAYLMNINF